MSNKEEEGAAVPTQQKASWSSFLKSIMASTSDLSSMTAPSFILSPVSLVEYPKFWAEPFDKFAAIAGGKTPEERQLLVTEWFLATLSGQFTRREEETGSEKKPLNPILGEQFIGHWNNGETTLFAEQVSHHPPVTAYHIENASKGISLEGHCAQKTSFSGRTIVVKQVGHANLVVKLSDGTKEKYLVTLPKLLIEGLWYGKPYVELTETSYIQGSHGLTTTIEYKGKGYFSGKAHSFSATIATGRASSSSPALYTIEGTWTGTSSYVKPSRSRVGDVFLDASSPRTQITVAPEGEQGEYESRRVWKAVADGIRKSDFESAGSAKNTLEVREREKRKEEKEQGRTFELNLFEKVAEDPDYTSLAAMCKHKPEREEIYLFKGKPTA